MQVPWWCGALPCDVGYSQLSDPVFERSVSAMTVSSRPQAKAGHNRSLTSAEVTAQPMK